MKMKKYSVLIAAGIISLSVAGCTAAATDTSDTSTTKVTISESPGSATTIISNTNDTIPQTMVSAEDSMLNVSEMFSDRDLEQTADLTDASYMTLSSGSDITIDKEGIYVLSGNVSETTVVIDSDDEAKVQLILDGVTVINEDAPAIYVKSADKVFITTTDTESVLTVTGAYAADGETNLDAVIFSKDDLVLNGTGTLQIVSKTGNGVTSKDDLKITGGIYEVTAEADAFEAKDSIRISDGNITIITDKDGLHSKNDDDLSLGYIYIMGGILTIRAAEDGIDGAGVVQIDGGTINIETSLEGIEGNYVQINGGDIDIYATDDGINATASGIYDVVIEVNGGTINVEVGKGDTDAFDSNGDLYINDGIITVTAPTSSFDADGVAQINGGDVTVNGNAVTEITQSRMGGPGGGARKRR